MSNLFGPDFWTSQFDLHLNCGSETSPGPQLQTKSQTLARREEVFCSDQTELQIGSHLVSDILDQMQ